MHDAPGLGVVLLARAIFAGGVIAAITSPSSRSHRKKQYRIPEAWNPPLSPAVHQHNAGQLPRDAHSVMLRSSFMGFHPQNVAGYHATQTAQLIDRFVANGFQNYYELATRNLIDP